MNDDEKEVYLKFGKLFVHLIPILLDVLFESETKVVIINGKKYDIPFDLIDKEKENE